MASVARREGSGKMVKTVFDASVGDVCLKYLGYLWSANVNLQSRSVSGIWSNELVTAGLQNFAARFVWSPASESWQLIVPEALNEPPVQKTLAFIRAARVQKHTATQP